MPFYFVKKTKKTNKHKKNLGRLSDFLSSNYTLDHAGKKLYQKNVN